MARLERLKRRLIRQAVRENLELIHARRPVQRRRAGERILRAARVLFFLAVPAALFASTYVLANVAVDWRRGSSPEAARVAAPSRRPVTPPEFEVLPPPQNDTEITRPEPIDPAVLPLALRTVVLDPGHGGENDGTQSPTGLVEKEVTLDIAYRLRDLLEKSSYRVVMTRTADSDLSLRQRAEFANRQRGDIFVSIHVNWLEKREVRGVETFYLGPTDDPYLEALAARENQQSGFSLADLKDLVQQVYAGFRQEESRRLAQAVQDSLFRALYQVNDGVRDRGVKSAPFGVLTRTEMPAILAEVSCVSNEVEARLLVTPIYRQYLAEALFRGIESYSHWLSREYAIDG